MNKYALTALKAVQNYNSSNFIVEFYERASNEIFETKTSREKTCPKNAFLGLCEKGMVKGIPKGNYTKSAKNKNYALKAVSILKANPEDSNTPKELWDKLELGNKIHNSQMDVVLALWENGLIVKK